ncbi:hypothetical protein EAS64_19005 [Trebonia kvetii]|uniref:LppX_LprAFG lipoprotein n=1 Tax=Trebonia kvetii TaxID=2480626 RepID=A0A6P2C1T8_9ACTN|nr:hypothetical protein [Trebonia kvetii]TVZ04455.1 hypothetical protein EAS64_19005 [Trebonia kvetii]
MNRSMIRVWAGAALLMLTVAACGGAQSSSGTGGTVPRATTSTPAANGVAAMRADQATRAALAALNSVRSVRMAGTFPANGRSERFDMRFAGNSAAIGNFTLNGAVVQTVTWDSVMYLKADQDGWAAMGNSPSTAGMMAGRWFKVGAAQAPGTTPLSLAFFTAELAAHATMTRATLTTGTLSGRQVAVIAYPDGSKLYVAATGPEYPLRFDVTGDTGGRRDFSGYGAALHIVAPSGATDISHG